MYSKNLVLLFFLAVFFSACEQTYQPKEKGYPRFDLPSPKYAPVTGDHPYSFEVSEFARVSRDSSRLAEPHWINIDYPSLGGVVSITYKEVDHDLVKLNKYIEDSRTLISKHNVKAYGIEETTIKTAQGQKAFVFALTGQVPTQFQFYTTDSSKHFLRGALYFRTAMENDSLAPAIQYISHDMLHLLNTLKWKNGQ